MNEWFMLTYLLRSLLPPTNYLPHNSCLAWQIVLVILLIFLFLRKSEVLIILLVRSRPYQFIFEFRSFKIFKKLIE